MAHVIGEFESQALFDGQPVRARDSANPAPRSPGVRINRLFRIVVEAARGRVVLLTPQRFQGRAVGDAEDPGGDQRGAAKVLRSLPDDQERVVDDLLDIFVARREARQKASEAPMVPEIELLQRTAITRPDGGQQVAVGLPGQFLTGRIMGLAPLLDES